MVKFLNTWSASLRLVQNSLNFYSLQATSEWAVWLCEGITTNKSSFIRDNFLISNFSPDVGRPLETYYFITRALALNVALPLALAQNVSMLQLSNAR